MQNAPAQVTIAAGVDPVSQAGNHAIDIGLGNLVGNALPVFLQFATHAAVVFDQEIGQFLDLNFLHAVFLRFFTVEPD